MKSQCCIFFDPFSIAFTSSSKSIDDKLCSFFAGYECDKLPDLTINIDTCGSMPDSLLSSIESSIPVIDENKFEIGPGIIRGTRNTVEKLMSIVVHDDFFLQPTLNIFQVFLYLVYYTLCYEQEIQSCFIHGCGVVCKGRPYLFIGPHGSGKTTLGLLSGGRILHDDQILLRIYDNKIYINSPPLSAKDNFRGYMDRSLEIDKIYVLHKDTSSFAKNCSEKKAFISLYNEIVLPLNLISVDEKMAKKTKFDLCYAILKSAKLFDLHFTLDIDFNACLV